MPPGVKFDATPSADWSLDYPFEDRALTLTPTQEPVLKQGTWTVYLKHDSVEVLCPRIPHVIGIFETSHTIDSFYMPYWRGSAALRAEFHGPGTHHSDYIGNENECKLSNWANIPQPVQRTQVTSPQCL